MLVHAFLVICGLGLFYGAAGAPATAETFGKGKSLGRVDQLLEASGLATSIIHKDVLYTHEDDGDAVIFAINSTTGSVITKLTVHGAINHDWEDITVGPCGPASCIYVADTGDSNDNSARNIIYRMRETPNLSDLTVEAVVSFAWPHIDGETLMVDTEGNIWLIPKVKNEIPQLYMLKPQHFNSQKVDLTGKGTPVSINLFGRKGPTSGDISRDGTEILIRGKDNLWYYKLGSGDTIREALSRTPTEVPVELEPQGEAVCWSPSADGYYTLSEGIMQPLYFHKRLNTQTILG